MATERPEEGDGSPRLGAWVLLPGATQWASGQRERGLAWFGTFAAALATSAFLWGTATGTALLAFAFAWHVAATADVVRRSVFPAPGRWVTLIGAAGGLGIGVYLPVLTIASLAAWPGMRDGPDDGFLVNCWAYQALRPCRDELVWYRPTPLTTPRVGRVVAAAGHRVEWSEGTLKIDGRPDQKLGPAAALLGPKVLRYQVPEGHVLIRSESHGAAQRDSVDGLNVVSHDQIVGRPRARFYPVHERRLL